MAKLSNVMQGMKILSSYYHDVNGYHVAAGHDQLFMYTTDKVVTDQDVAELKRLGWFQDEDQYDPNEGWSIFV